MKKVMKFYPFLLVLLLYIVSCSQNKKQPYMEMEASVLDDSLEIVDCVEKIYDEVFDFYNKNENVSMIDFDHRFLSSDFQRCYRDLDMASSQETGEIIGINHDHWIQAQDWDKLSMKIQSVKLGKKPIVTIKIIHSGNIQHSEKNVDLVLTKEDEERWTIDDFVANGFSEKEYIKECTMKSEENKDTIFQDALL